MNVCFRLPTEDFEARFLAEASVDALVSFMKDFEKANG